MSNKHKQIITFLPDFTALAFTIMYFIIHPVAPIVAKYFLNVGVTLSKHCPRSVADSVDVEVRVVLSYQVVT